MLLACRCATRYSPKCWPTRREQERAQVANWRTKRPSGPAAASLAAGGGLKSAMMTIIIIISQLQRPTSGVAQPVVVIRAAAAAAGASQRLMVSGALTHFISSASHVSSQPSERRHWPLDSFFSFCRPRLGRLGRCSLWLRLAKRREERQLNSTRLDSTRRNNNKVTHTLAPLRIPNWTRLMTIMLGGAAAAAAVDDSTTTMMLMLMMMMMAMMMIATLRCPAMTNSLAFPSFLLASLNFSRCAHGRLMP